MDPNAFILLCTSTGHTLSVRCARESQVRRKRTLFR